MSKELKLSAEYHKGRVNCSEVLSSVPEYRSKWYFSEKELEINSPSRMDGIDWKMENYIRRLYCSFIKKLGQELHVPQLTIATAIMFCHRFYMRQSLAKNDWQHLNVATATGMTEHESEAKRAHNHPLHPHQSPPLLPAPAQLPRRHHRPLRQRHVRPRGPLLSLLPLLRPLPLSCRLPPAALWMQPHRFLRLHRVCLHECRRRPAPPDCIHLPRDSGGGQGGIKATTPHAFLLARQMFAEGAPEAGGSSAPVRSFVPMFYNTKRLITISEWVRSEVVKAEEGEYSNARRLHIGWGLALLNLAFRSVNLFKILVPIYLPRAFKSYYGSKEKPL